MRKEFRSGRGTGIPQAGKRDRPIGRDSAENERQGWLNQNSQNGETYLVSLYLLAKIFRRRFG
jgi:hypothetical protein